MTLEGLLRDLYVWADARALAILLVSTALPLVGALLARIGRGGKTDADGRFIANVVVGLGLGYFVLEVLMLLVAQSAMDLHILDANPMLLLAPVGYLALALLTIRQVFPLNQLGSFRQACDVGLFVFVCWLIVWLFQRFAWGVVFLGGFAQLLLLGLVVAGFLYRLWSRIRG